jgi:hypothetical protein
MFHKMGTFPGSARKVSPPTPTYMTSDQKCESPSLLQCLLEALLGRLAHQPQHLTYPTFEIIKQHDQLVLAHHHSSQMTTISYHL